MHKEIRYINPGGNVTAIVCKPCEREERIAFSKAIMEQGRAEQVGFEVPPLKNSFGRLEMMGGEFCGNATRAFGFMKVKDAGLDGFQKVMIEISGTEKPVCVEVDLAHEEAYTHMPVPKDHDMVKLLGQAYTRVRMEGIDHIMVPGTGSDSKLVDAMIKTLYDDMADGCGMMFLEKTETKGCYRLVPAVYVKATDSLVWESSCGSGSVAAAWYYSLIEDQDVEELHITFHEPGGDIKVNLKKSADQVTDCLMGGPVCEL